MHTPTTITPMLREALLALHALPAPAKRTRGGFAIGFDIITRRTANTLVDHGLARFDNDSVPSELSATSAGKRIAVELAAAPRAKAGVA